MNVFSIVYIGRFRTGSRLGLDLKKSEPSQVKSLVRNRLGSDFLSEIRSCKKQDRNHETSQRSKGFAAENKCEQVSLGSHFVSHLSMLFSTLQNR